MTNNRKLQLLEELNKVVNQLPSVESCQLTSATAGSQFQIRVLLDTYPVERTWNGRKAHVHMPKAGVFDLRLVTNPIRRIFKKSQVDIHISTPLRHYRSRKSTLNEFIGYESPEILLDIL
jgi:hypothetical protein